MVLNGIVTAVSPDDPLVGPAFVVGAEETVVAPDVTADVVALSPMENVAVMIVIFTVMTVSLHHPIQKMKILIWIIVVTVSVCLPPDVPFAQD